MHLPRRLIAPPESRTEVVQLRVLLFALLLAVALRKEVVRKPKVTVVTWTLLHLRVAGQTTIRFSNHVAVAESDSAALYTLHVLLRAVMREKRGATVVL